MFKSLRWRLAILFVLLATLVYTAFTALGLCFFHRGLTNALDEEMKELASDIMPSVTVTNMVPSLKSWASAMALEPTKPPTTIQLYSKEGKLIDEFGPKGIPMLIKHEVERKHGQKALRIVSVPLLYEGQQIGYLQLEHPTNTRDHSVRQFAVTMTLVAPLLLLGLGLSGYFFSAQAIAPVEHSLKILRNFMADAGHELKTPISIIQVNAEAMEEELDERSLSLHQLKVITRATGQMNNLVQDLVLLAKMESPQLESHPQIVSLPKLVYATVEEFIQLAQQKEITLAVKDCHQAQVAGDHDSIKRLLTNLLANALRYTDKGGFITVSLECSGRQAKLSVTDTGIGIPKECLPHIFERFYRVDKSRSRAQGGTGLGLSIVKAIVESHHGKIEVTSALGQGSTFSILLPTIS